MLLLRPCSVQKGRYLMLTPTLVHQQLQTLQTLAHVWGWVGTAEGLSRWLNGRVRLEAHEGGIYEERGAYLRGDYVLRGRVLKIVPSVVLVLSIRLDMADAGRWPIYTPIEMLLTRSDAHTLFQVSHKGFENLPEAYRDSAFADFSEGWAVAFGRLRELVHAEKGA